TVRCWWPTGPRTSRDRESLTWTTCIRTFGGPKRNRLFMAASHSLYALHLNVRGAVG
ncbi:MAG: hypothetical protein RI988_644, partial [Pseudomonadota bacterium]